MKQNATYNAFISYSHADSGDIAAQLQKGIENIGKPWYKLGRSLNVFRDETNVSANPHLWPIVEKALNNSDYFILLASPFAAKSNWIKEEVNFWINNCFDTKDGLKRFFIVQTGGNIEWSKKLNDFNWETTDCLPIGLSNKFLYEPLWINLKDYIRQNQQKQKEVDFRAAGFTRQMTKIIGAIVGKDPRDIESDELNRTRNIKRFLSVLALTLITLLITSIILYFSEKDVRKEAEKNLKDFEIEKFQRDIRDGNGYFEAEEYCDAKECFMAADSAAKKYASDTIIKQRSHDLKSKLDSCESRCKTISK